MMLLTGASKDFLKGLDLLTHLKNVGSSDFVVFYRHLVLDHILLLNIYLFLDTLLLKTRFRGENIFSIPQTDPLRCLSESLKIYVMFIFNPIIEKKKNNLGFLPLQYQLTMTVNAISRADIEYF